MTSTEYLKSLLDKSFLTKDHIVLVTGGNGFIGSHVANALHGLGYFVRIADIVPSSSFKSAICSEMMVGNLSDPAFCARSTRGAAIVLHFAAAMGGMGTIHSANDFPIYNINHSMTVALLQASVEANVQRFLYASSACVYPTSLYAVGGTDFRLAEGDVWAVTPPSPQGLYGQEKLNSEMMLNQYASKLGIRIARFHNIYGPRGAWCNGREKAPAALLRKAIAIKMSFQDGQSTDIAGTIELWGDGTQRRSFLFIDDCVEAVIRLLLSDCKEAVNIGSEEDVSIMTLAHLALNAADVDRNQVVVEYDASKPVGVTARNSNNDFVKAKIGWEPSTSLEKGMKVTAAWLKPEVEAMLHGRSARERQIAIEALKSSRIVNLSSETVKFAILLPTTSRGSDNPGSCLRNLAGFARSLYNTTWRDTHALGALVFDFAVYLAIDSDDDFLLGEGEENRARAVLYEAGITTVKSLVCSRPRGHVCALWRDCAERAWKDGYDYFTLMGDDVILLDEGWMRTVHAEFGRLAEEERVPIGIGCVAFTDISFPGMPTFPVVHRTHMEIFHGKVIPEVFINQDGDPYLFQLYRRWGCSTMIKARVENAIGGSEQARYRKQHASGWTFDVLDLGVQTVQSWMVEQHAAWRQKLSLDVVIPCYRVQLAFLDRILGLMPSPTCTVMFIIIVDNPTSTHITELLNKYGARPDVRIRVNDRNMGASASRNRGMAESAAEWIHFLDDDVVPQPNLIVEAEKAIRSHPKAAGFVGNVQFPMADTVFKTAVHLAGITYFWDIATKWDKDVPWGVTASLIARRNIRDGIEYDLAFPKTGGGEDIDFCLKKHHHSVSAGGEGFYAAPDLVATHPWWNDGIRSYWRFYMWSKGDGALVKLYPQYSYYDAAPSSAELLLIPALLCPVSVLLSVLACDWHLAGLPFLAVASIVIANVVHDSYRHLWRDRDRTKCIKSSIKGITWITAVLESSFIRLASEGGRVMGMLERREISHLMMRFDWFVGRAGAGPREEERKNSRQRFFLTICILAMVLGYTGSRG